MEQWAVPKQNLYLTLYSQICALWDNPPLNKCLDNVLSEQCIGEVLSEWGNQRRSRFKTNAWRNKCMLYMSAHYCSSCKNLAKQKRP